MSFDTPILIIFWRRSSSLLRVIESLRLVAPTKLFLASDGPRQDNSLEAEQVAEARLLAEKAIDWPCDIARRYSENNHGVKYGPINALNWFFSQVEEGIILEDDCLPHPSFFGYCENLLERFRDDQRIWHISGNNFLGDESPSDYSYYFSKYTFIWGWATWRRCWTLYDPEMKSWSQMKTSHLLKDLFPTEEEWDYWSSRWDEVAVKHTATWDYQWMYTCIVNGGISIVPKCNLVSNIGFGDGGVHTFDQDSELSNIPSRAIDVSIIHPINIMQNHRADKQLFLRVLKEPEEVVSIPRKWWLKAYFTSKGILRSLRARILG